MQYSWPIEMLDLTLQYFSPIETPDLILQYSASIEAPDFPVYKRALIQSIQTVKLMKLMNRKYIFKAMSINSNKIMFLMKSFYM